MLLSCAKVLKALALVPLTGLLTSAALFKNPLRSVAVVLPLSPPCSATFVIAELALTLSSESKATSTSTSSELLRIRTALSIVSLNVRADI